VFRSSLLSSSRLALSSAGFHPGASAQTAGADRRTHGSASCRVETPVQWNAGHGHLDRRLQRRLCGGAGRVAQHNGRTSAELVSRSRRSRRPSQRRVSHGARLHGRTLGGWLCHSIGETSDPGEAERDPRWNLRTAPRRQMRSADPWQNTPIQKPAVFTLASRERLRSQDRIETVVRKAGRKSGHFHRW